jgi:Predicted permeases
MELFHVLIGLITGLLSGYGIGGGTLLMLWLTLVCKTDQLTAAGINLLYFIFPAVPALFGHSKNKLVEKEAVIFCVLTGIPACIAVSFFVSHLPLSLLRRLFGVFLLVIGTRELFSKPKDSVKQK